MRVRSVKCFRQKIPAAASVAVRHHLGDDQTHRLRLFHQCGQWRAIANAGFPCCPPRSTSHRFKSTWKNQKELGLIYGKSALAVGKALV